MLKATKESGKSKFEDMVEDREDVEEDEIDGKESREEFDEEYILKKGNREM